MSDNKMRVGLLWLDDDPKKEVSLKIKEAAERYFEKFGRWPNVCYVNPATLLLPQNTEGVGMEDVHLDSLRVLSSPLVLPDHFWVGESPQPKERKKRAPQSRG